MNNGVKSNAEIGEQLRKYRLLNGYSLREVSAAINKSVGTISHWENGRRRPDPDVFIRLLDLYQVKDFNDFKMIPLPPQEGTPLTDLELKLLNTWRNLSKEKQTAFLALLEK